MSSVRAGAVDVTGWQGDVLLDDLCLCMYLVLQGAG